LVGDWACGRMGLFGECTFVTSGICLEGRLHMYFRFGRFGGETVLVTSGIKLGRLDYTSIFAIGPLGLCSNKKRPGKLSD